MIGVYVCSSYCDEVGVRYGDVGLLSLLFHCVSVVDSTPLIVHSQGSDPQMCEWCLCLFFML